MYRAKGGWRGDLAPPPILPLCSVDSTRPRLQLTEYQRRCKAV